MFLKTEVTPTHAQFYYLCVLAITNLLQFVHIHALISLNRTPPLHSNISKSPLY